MSQVEYDVVIAGSGIVGLATALALQSARPELSLAVVEKEPDVAQHQSSHNSGVVHAGLYYRPGSLRAKLAVEGAVLLEEFCTEHRLPFERFGKVIVATNEEEVPRLEELYRRGTENGVRGLELIDGRRLQELEPRPSPFLARADLVRASDRCRHLLVSGAGVLDLFAGP